MDHKRKKQKQKQKISNNKSTRRKQGIYKEDKSIHMVIPKTRSEAKKHIKKLRTAIQRHEDKIKTFRFAISCNRNEIRLLFKRWPELKESSLEQEQEQTNQEDNVEDQVAQSVDEADTEYGDEEHHAGVSSH